MFPRWLPSPRSHDSASDFEGERHVDGRSGYPRDSGSDCLESVTVRRYAPPSRPGMRRPATGLLNGSPRGRVHRRSDGRTSSCAAIRSVSGVVTMSERSASDTEHCREQSSILSREGVGEALFPRNTPHRRTAAGGARKIAGFTTARNCCTLPERNGIPASIVRTSGSVDLCELWIVP